MEVVEIDGDGQASGSQVNSFLHMIGRGMLWALHNLMLGCTLMEVVLTQTLLVSRIIDQCQAVFEGSVNQLIVDHSEMQSSKHLHILISFKGRAARHPCRGGLI